MTNNIFDFSDFIDAIKEAVKIFIVIEVVKASLRPRTPEELYPNWREEIRYEVDRYLRERMRERAGEL